MRPVDQAREATHVASVLARAGVLRPIRPDRAVRLAQAYRHWGVSLAAAFATSAARFDDRVAVIDELGTSTYRDLDRRSNAIAHGLKAAGIDDRATVGVLCRNHHYFLEVTAALAKLGADALYLNTGFSAPQLRDVMQREHASLLVLDDEFTAVADDAGITNQVLAWTATTGLAATALDDLVADHLHAPPPDRPAREGRTIILTSGTTGVPKGAARAQSASAGPAIALLERIPYRAGETMVIAAPCFHSWGFANALVGLLLGNTLVLHRRFDPAATLAALTAYDAQVLVAVPVMLARILDDAGPMADLPGLRLVPLSGSAIPGDLALRFMDVFGDVVYNLYGSTEAGYVAIATPADLRVAPGTAGRPPRDTEVRLLDVAGQPVAAGATGRIFVRGGLVFDGYTDGGWKPIIDGFMQTGDTGHLDEHGLLFVDGRDDDMIVTGGENVFPGEIEDVLASHPGIVEAAVVGMPDPEFGQRLKAYVVTRSGSLTADDVRAYVRANLATYKVPRDVAFVGTLPRNATGKIIRSDLG